MSSKSYLMAMQYKIYQSMTRMMSLLSWTIVVAFKTIIGRNFN